MGTMNGNNLTPIPDPSFLRSPSSQSHFHGLHAHDPGCACGEAATTDHGRRYQDMSSTQLQNAEVSSNYLVTNNSPASWWSQRQSLPAYPPSGFGHLNAPETLPLSPSDSQTVAGSQLQIPSGSSTSGHNSTSPSGYQFFSTYDAYPFQSSFTMGDASASNSHRDVRTSQTIPPKSPVSEKSESDDSASPSSPHAVPRSARPEYGPHRGGRDNKQITFPDMKTLLKLKCQNEIVTPDIQARMDKNLMWVDNQWTCYRRNYITIHTNYTLKPATPGAYLYVMTKEGEKQVQALGVSLSASMDEPQGKSIGLIQHTAKRDRGPQSDVGIRKLSPSLPGTTFPPYHGSTSTNGPYLPMQAEGEQQNSSMTPSGQHTFERIQFKQATANNGRRRAQQQFYHIMVELHADVRKSAEDKEQWIKVAQKISEAMVVRGRSPGHYKDAPNSSGASSGNSGGASGASYGFGGLHGRGPIHSYGALSSSGRNSMSGAGTSYRGNQCLPSPHVSLLAPPSHAFSPPARRFAELPTLPAMGESASYPSFGSDESYRYYHSPPYETGLRAHGSSTVKPDGLHSPTHALGGTCGQEEPSVDSSITPLWTVTTCNRIPDLKSGFPEGGVTY